MFLTGARYMNLGSHNRKKSVVFTQRLCRAGERERHRHGSESSQVGVEHHFGRLSEADINDLIDQKDAKSTKTTISRACSIFREFLVDEGTCI